MLQGFIGGDRESTMTGLVYERLALAFDFPKFFEYLFSLRKCTPCTLIPPQYSNDQTNYESAKKG
jgi:hypothetical protein